MSRLTLGAPGIYSLPDEPIRALTGARMDVCAFVGVAPRGPSRPPRFEADWAREPGSDASALPRSVAVPVESFDAYRRLYGGFEGPGLLPYAVASFFEQGGLRAYVVRIVHDYRPDAVAEAAGVARGALARGSVVLTTRGGTPITLRARDEGAWGNAVTATLSFSARTIPIIEATLNDLVIPPGLDLPPGSLVRLTSPGGARALRFITSIIEEHDPGRAGTRLRAVLDAAVAASPEGVELVLGSLAVDDHDRSGGSPRREIIDRVGLSSQHPRWLAAALFSSSSLLYPDADWIDGDIDLGDASLADFTTQKLEGGVDRHGDIVPEDFFGDWVPGDPPDAGVHALVGIADVASVCVPDLYSPAALPPVEAVMAPATLSGPTFERCVYVAAGEQVAQPVNLVGLRLDPEQPADLAQIIALQQRVVALADALQSFVVLLDVPPRLHQRRIVAWRSAFSSAFAAAYHPWLRVLRPSDGALVAVSPSAFAAGIIAQREHALGIPHGPANVLAAGVVNVDDVISPARHDELHPLGINVFLRERDGVRLTAARTLSRDQDYRQLSVRRLMTMLRRTLDRQMQWVVFEPNSSALRADVRYLLESFLRRLYQADAFRGATEREAFFVRCDDQLNPQRVLDAGQLIVEVGVAPAEPLEFVVLRIARDGDGTIRVEG